MTFFPKRRIFNGASALVVAGAVFVTSVMPAQTQGRGISLVRDAEIERLVRDYTRPIFKAARLNNKGIEIFLVNDSRFNAFVSGRRMFINTGALLQSETPNEIIGVIAHEAGHIAGGHLTRLRDRLARAKTMAVLSALAGVGAMAAGAATKNRGLSQAGSGIISGGSEVARRTLFAYQRSEEAAADRSAIAYLDKTKQSANGMLKTFERLGNSLSFGSGRVDPFKLSHPLPRERVANLSVAARKSPFFTRKDPPDLVLRHDLMRVKLAAYTQGANAVRRYTKGKAKSVVLYADVLNTYLYGNPRSALKKADKLVKSYPKNPYFHEARGDIAIKAGQVKTAIAAYQRAIKLEPGSSNLIRVQLGQAYVAAGDGKAALGQLVKATARDRANARAHQSLAQAYAMVGDIPNAELSTAEARFYAGNFSQAKQFAARAQQKLKRGSPAWLRADDILKFKVVR